jgi:hypothetical protein
MAIHEALLEALRERGPWVEASILYKSRTETLFG